jgi:thymidylate synthase
MQGTRRRPACQTEPILLRKEDSLVWSPPSFGRFEDAYIGLLAHISQDAEHDTISRGNHARECLNVSFVLTDPRDRLILVPERRANIVFCFAEALWYLQGRDDLDMIGYYAPRLARFSADGQRLAGSAYGPKLFGPGPSGRSRWDQVLALLASDPGSKRAVMSIFDPGELDDPSNPDVSCTLALQFLVRDGCLHTIAWMRANDAVTGLACDVFSFTLIAELTARTLGVPLGSYAHHAGSMHINEPDAAIASAITVSARSARRSFPVATMPRTGRADLAVLARLEEDLRLDRRQILPGDQANLGLAPYWQQVALLFEAHRQIIHRPGEPVTTWLPYALEPAYRQLVMQRWPSRIQAPARAAAR